MSTMHNLHAIRIKAPFFAKHRRSVILRYLDADFINRFRQDVQQQQLNHSDIDQWLEEERHSHHDSKPVLRLPSHRAFHVICCEVACQQFGSPALDPSRISSAGFVIRRRQNGSEQAWTLENGEALGWLPAANELRDPDLDRRLCRNGVLHARSNKPAYSGEETHPLHVLNSHDEKGKRHTLLFGYLPLGGFYYERNAQASVDEQSFNEVSNYMSASLPWPFGYRDGKHISWQEQHSKAIDNGIPSDAMFELLRLWVNRYHLGNINIADNEALASITQSLHLYDHSQLPKVLKSQAVGTHQSQQYRAYSKMSLWDYLETCYQQGENNPLARWVISQEDRREINASTPLQPLPNTNGVGSMALCLSTGSSDAQDIRHTLQQRFRTQTLAKTKEIPLPKFGQGEQDIFEVLPFVRSLNDDGKEQIQWINDAARSMQFRVAAPFDPEASRPSLIQMPSLRDLKRGLARGASILTPGDTFDIINNLNKKKGVSPDLINNSPSAGLGLQWICSFSLPVITLVAMILLMIMISLLNIVFFWLPWVRICLPFPKINKG